MLGSSIATIDDALARMDANLDRAIDQRDPRGYFTAVYRGVTQRVRDGVAAGEFEDNERMERFDVRFARYWLDAYAGWDRGDPIADSWSCSFEAARRGATVMQNLVLGINAHINLDLAVADNTGFHQALIVKDIHKLSPQEAASLPKSEMP